MNKLLTGSVILLMVFSCVDNNKNEKFLSDIEKLQKLALPFELTEFHDDSAIIHTPLSLSKTKLFADFNELIKNENKLIVGVLPDTTNGIVLLGVNKTCYSRPKLYVYDSKGILNDTLSLFSFYEKYDCLPNAKTEHALRINKEQGVKILTSVVDCGLDSEGNEIITTIWEADSLKVTHRKIGKK